MSNSSSSLYQGRSSVDSTVYSQNHSSSLSGSSVWLNTQLFLVLGSCSLLLSYQGLMCFLDHALLSFSLTCTGKVTMAHTSAPLPTHVHQGEAPHAVRQLMVNLLLIPPILSPGKLVDISMRKYCCSSAHVVECRPFC